MITLILIYIAAVANAWMDMLQHRYDSSMFGSRYLGRLFPDDWWDPRRSWKNKWKNGNPNEGAAFFLSTSVFVWLTDAWHFIKMIMLVCLMAAVVNYEPWGVNALMDFGIYGATWFVAFQLNWNFFSWGG